MLSRIVDKKEAEHASNAALLSVRGAFESVSGSRVSAGFKGSGLREVWSRPQPPPFGEYAVRCPLDGQLPGHQIGAWVVGEGD
jgi:hypothetical protein